MSALRKFQFDACFDGLGQEDEDRIEPSFGTADLDLARRQSWADGRDEGERTALASIERRAADATDRLVMALDELNRERDRADLEAQRRAAGIALEALRRLFPALIERSGTAELEAALERVLAAAAEQPRLVVRVPAGIEAAIEPAIRAAAARSAFDGRLTVIGDPGLAGDDYRIEWPEGGVERDGRGLIDRLDRMLTDYLDDFDRRALPADPAAEEEGTPT